MDLLSGSGKEDDSMTVDNILSLILVIFTVLIYLDNHYHK
jgi:hypothetical protein